MKCRSQKQIDSNVTIAEAIEDEKRFFSDHPVYGAHTDKLGVGFMSEQLNKILQVHIGKCIPGLLV
jgi:dynamin 1-like protein